MHLFAVADHEAFVRQEFALDACEVRGAEWLVDKLNQLMVLPNFEVGDFDVAILKLFILKGFDGHDPWPFPIDSSDFKAQGFRVRSRVISWASL